MSTASHRVLTDLFQNHLHFTPTATDSAQFADDLRVVSPSLIKASLKELGAGKRRPVGGRDWRRSMFEIYNRKVAEHAQMFPMFHCFETAFRSTVAVDLEDHYGIKQWWKPLYDQICGGATASRIGNVPGVSNERRRAIKILVESFDKQKLLVMSYQDGYELLEDSTLSDIKRLIESHWPLFKDRFYINNQPIPYAVFKDKYDNVRNARNSVYHHKSFSGMNQVYQDANDLLKCLQFALPPVHARISETQCQEPPYFPAPSIPVHAAVATAVPATLANPTARIVSSSKATP